MNTIVLVAIGIVFSVLIAWLILAAVRLEKAVRILERSVGKRK